MQYLSRMVTDFFEKTVKGENAAVEYGGEVEHLGRFELNTIVVIDWTDATLKLHTIVVAVTGSEIISLNRQKKVEIQINGRPVPQ